MSRSDREGWYQLTWLFQFALVQTCQLFALSVICFANASSPKGRAEKPVRISCPYAQTKRVSPSGRDVAQRQRGLVPADMAFQICPDTSLSACCPLSHLLRKCQLSQRESREAGANLFALTCNPNLSLPPGEMSRSDREGWYQLTWLFKFALTRAFCSARKTKTEHLSILCLLVGGGGFEPPKSLTTDLQSAPFGHSGNLPYSLAEIVELVDGLEPPTC